MKTLSLAPCRIECGGTSFHLSVQAGQSLSELIWLSGQVAAPALCSGIGRCGQCRVRFVAPLPKPSAGVSASACNLPSAPSSVHTKGSACLPDEASLGALPASPFSPDGIAASAPPAPLLDEYSILGEEAVAQGWRLACRHAAEQAAGWLLELPKSSARSERESFVQPAALSPKSSLLLAVDLGTTSLCWQAITAQGQVIAQGRQPNPQAGAGADIMQRLHKAQQPQGKAHLSWLVRQALAGIIASLPAPVSELCLAANPAMTGIFLLHDITGLCAAPYTLAHHGNILVRALPLQPEGLNLCHGAQGTLPPVFVPPQLFPFIGGDVSAGLLALSQQPEVQYPFLLADMGTNGEFILAQSPSTFLAASAPLGPALEGCGLTLGDVAGAHTATAFSLSPLGLQPQTPSGLPAQRISGTGYLSLLATLVRVGLLDREGHFVHHPVSPLARRLAQGLQAGCLHLSPELYLTSHDVEALLKVKAAFSLAIESLLNAAAVPANALTVFLAGALGEHVQPHDLITLGFLPAGLCSIQAAGNTALQGAALLLQKPALRDTVAALAKQCCLLPVAESATFTHDYMRHMRF